MRVKSILVLSAALSGAAMNSSAQTVAQACHPSYVGVCVPYASDVDCASGNGNGPVYVRGPFRVVGPDVYGLDRDHDGIACERG